MRNSKSTAVKSPVQDIPDSSQAEAWITEDVFVFKGKLYRTLPDFRVVRVNGDKPEAEA